MPDLHHPPPAALSFAEEATTHLAGIEPAELPVYLLALVQRLDSRDPDRPLDGAIDALTAALEVRLREGSW